MKIFWSWQSDNDQGSGRYFVRSVLDELAKDLNDLDGTVDAPREEDIPWVEIDHDTKDVAGSPPIVDTILDKIGEAAVFVADLTPVGKTLGGGKHLANPNVMIELGYAIRALGHQRIVLVLNEASGISFDELPFDLKHLRGPLLYRLPDKATKAQKVDATKQLKSQLRSRIVASLRVAQQQMEALRLATMRDPVLTIEIIGPDDVPRAVVADRGPPAIPSIEELRLQFPPMPMPTPEMVEPGGQSRVPSLASRIRPAPTREQVERYNGGLETYYLRCQAYAAALHEHHQLLARTFEVRIRLDNDGTVPGTNIDVHVTMPPGVVLYKMGEELVAPIAPVAPNLYKDDRSHAFARYLPEHPALRMGNSSWIDVDPSMGTVRFHTESLKHGYTRTSEAFRVSLRTIDDVTSQTFAYTISADNLPVQAVGNAVFTVECARPSDEMRVP